MTEATEEVELLRLRLEIAEQVCCVGEKPNNIMPMFLQAPQLLVVIEPVLFILLQCRKS